MKIAFTAKDIHWNSEIDPKFGRADYLLIYDTETDTLNADDNKENANVAHGAGPKTAEKLFNYEPDVLITGNGPGGNAKRALDQGDLEVYAGANGMTIKEAYQAYQDGELNKMD